MADKVKYVYAGPPVFVVELQQEVRDGDKVTGSPALGSAYGFTRAADLPKPSEKGDK